MQLMRGVSNNCFHHSGSLPVASGASTCIVLSLPIVKLFLQLCTVIGIDPTNTVLMTITFPGGTMLVPA
jgi:hypothetical protein